MNTLAIKQDFKCAVNVKTGKVLTGYGNHASFIQSGYDLLVRAIVFPSRKRVYFRFYKPDGDFYFVNDKDKANSFNVCYTAWEILIKKGYADKSYTPLFAVTDNVITEGDIKC
jgi:hypothetical protein